MRPPVDMINRSLIARSLINRRFYKKEKLNHCNGLGDE